MIWLPEWLKPKPKTTDEVLVSEIRAKVSELRNLCETADARGITVWIGGQNRLKFFSGRHIVVQDAYSTTLRRY